MGIGEHETSADGSYSLMTEECPATCDHGPCMVVNEKLHKCVSPSQVEKILNDADNDVLDVPRSDLYDGAERNQG